VVTHARIAQNSVANDISERDPHGSEPVKLIETEEIHWLR
jgi:hypothetical protein